MGTRGFDSQRGLAHFDQLIAAIGTHSPARLAREPDSSVATQIGDAGLRVLAERQVHGYAV